MHREGLWRAALLNGIAPVPSIGVFENAKIRGRNIFTWEPQSGVRVATVIVPYYTVEGGGSGFVLVGRSLCEMERVIEEIAFDVLIGWIVMMGASFVAVFITNLKHWEKRKNVSGVDTELLDGQMS